MSRPLCVATHRLFAQTRAHLDGHCDLVMNETDGSWQRARLLETIAPAQAVIAFMPDHVDRAFLDAAPDLRLVAAALKGYDNIDVRACARRGVTVSIVPDLLTAPTAELAIALLIGLARHVLEGDRDVRSGAFREWRPTLYGLGLEGATVGLLGYGRIGQAIARRLAPFGCRLLAHDRRTQEDGLVRPVAAAELAGWSDALIICLPLNRDTRHRVSTDFIAEMKRGALLVNPARGSVVDEAAVARALETGALGGYAADVFEFEDWALDDRPRRLHSTLAAMTDKTLFTPHLGSATFAARKAIEIAAADNVIDLIEGRVPRDALAVETGS